MKLNFSYIYSKLKGGFMNHPYKSIFLTIITIFALSTIASANTCTDAYFISQAHATFNQESNFRLDSIFFSQSPAGWKGKKFFYNNSLIEKVMVDFKRNETLPAYWFFYRDTNETVLNKNGFYEYIDSTYKKQDTLFHHLKTYYDGDYKSTQIYKITTDYYSEKMIYEDKTNLFELFLKQDSIIEIKNFNYNTDSSTVKQTFYVAEANDDYKCNEYDEQQNLIHTYTYSPTENGFSLKQIEGDKYTEIFVINEEKIRTSIRKTLNHAKIPPKARYFDLLGRFKFSK